MGVHEFQDGTGQVIMLDVTAAQLSSAMSIVTSRDQPLAVLNAMMRTGLLY